MIQPIDEDLISNNSYIVRFARNKTEVKKAQELRFNVFNMELGEGLADSYENKRDMDPYDEQCHHLLVISKKCDQVIGTYRMQTYDKAQQHNGFYTAREFNLSGIPADILENSVEVGRACIDADHRNGRVLFFLWRGLAKYMTHFNKRYLLGCCSLTSQSAEEAWRVMNYLEHRNFMHEKYRISPTGKYRCPAAEGEGNGNDDILLPQLFRLYMDLGAKVCSSTPALDIEFKTIDYLVLLDIEDLDEHTRLLFFN